MGLNRVIRKCKFSRCRKPLPADARADMEYCNSTCRSRACRERKQIANEAILNRFAELEERVQKCENSIRAGVPMFNDDK